MNKFLKASLTILLIAALTVLALYLLSVIIASCIKYSFKKELKSMQKSINDAHIDENGKLEIKFRLNWISEKYLDELINSLKNSIKGMSECVSFEDKDGIRKISISVGDKASMQNAGLADLVVDCVLLYFIEKAKHKMIKSIDERVDFLNSLNSFIIPVNFVLDVCSGMNPIQRYEREHLRL